MSSKEEGSKKRKTRKIAGRATEKEEVVDIANAPDAPPPKKRMVVRRKRENTPKGGDQTNAREPEVQPSEEKVVDVRETMEEDASNGKKDCDVEGKQTDDEDGRGEEKREGTNISESEKVLETKKVFEPELTEKTRELWCYVACLSSVIESKGFPQKYTEFFIVKHKKPENEQDADNLRIKCLDAIQRVRKEKVRIHDEISLGAPHEFPDPKTGNVYKSHVSTTANLTYGAYCGISNRDGFTKSILHCENESISRYSTDMGGEYRLFFSRFNSNVRVTDGCAIMPATDQKEAGRNLDFFLKDFPYPNPSYRGGCENVQVPVGFIEITDQFLSERRNIEISCGDGYSLNIINL